jgi:hypothetical protein
MGSDSTEESICFGKIEEKSKKVGKKIGDRA